MSAFVTLHLFDGGYIHVRADDVHSIRRRLAPDGGSVVAVFLAGTPLEYMDIREPDTVRWAVDDALANAHIPGYEAS